MSDTTISNSVSRSRTQGHHTDSLTSRTTSAVPSTVVTPKKPAETGVYLKEDSAGKYELKQLDAPNAVLFGEAAPAGPYIVTGPVIGMVTHDMARVVIEMNVKSSVTCFLTDSEGQQYAVKYTFKAHRPAAFVFQGLSPATSYRVTFNVPSPGMVKSGFRTLPADWSIKRDYVNVAFVSGNKIVSRDMKNQRRTDLWKDVYRMSSKGLIDLVVHTGNNVYSQDDEANESSSEYMKNRWDVAVSILDEVEPHEWPLYYKEICEIAREMYRETWNHPTTRHALANVPNLMILGDRDIRRNWGSLPEDSDPSSMEFFIACCFYNVYNEYQRNLFEDYTPGKTVFDSAKVGQSHHFHLFGDIGLMILDTVGCKTFHKNYYNLEQEEQVPLFGVSQWRDITSALKKDGYFSSCRMLFVTCKQPPCYVGEGFSMFFAKMSPYFNALAGHMSSTENVAETSMLLQALFDWRAADRVRRECCIVGGNVLEGGYTDIVDRRYTGTGMDTMRQITTSGVADASLKGYENFVMRIARLVKNSVGNWHDFNHYQWQGMRNFNVVTVFGEKERSNGRHAVATRFASQMYAAGDSYKRSFPAVLSTDQGLMVTLRQMGGCQPKQSSTPYLSAQQGSVYG